MKGFLLFLIILASSYLSIAQHAINVQARQRNAEIIISYELPSTSPQYIFNIKVFCKIGNVDSFELKSVTGDVGLAINGGKEQYSVIWDVFEDVDEFSTANFFVNAELTNAELFYSEIDSHEYILKLESEKIIKQAQSDAKNYYKNSGAIWGTGCATLTFIPLGVVVATISSISEPQLKHLNIPYGEYYNNDTYKKAYIEQAMKLKRRSVWTAFGISSVPSVIMVILSLAL